MGAIMEFATEKQIESFLSTCHIEGQKNFLMAFKKKTWLKSFIDFFIIGGAYYSQLKQEQDKRASKKVLQLSNTFLRCFLI